MQQNIVLKHHLRRYACGRAAVRFAIRGPTGRIRGETGQGNLTQSKSKQKQEVEAKGNPRNFVRHSENALYKDEG